MKFKRREIVRNNRQKYFGKANSDTNILQKDVNLKGIKKSATRGFEN
jgi:hypothetical protein